MPEAPTWWYRSQSWQRSVLLPLSWLFQALVTLRRSAYRRGWRQVERLPVPVVVVGNITVGGSGKTPLVVRLVELLRDQGWYPGVISRGYGGRAMQWPQAVSAGSDPAQVGDEPLLLARRCRCPLWVGPDRVAAARALLAAHPQCDVLISDDGLQHYRLGRDLELVVLDGERRLGNDACLPAGPLREPPSRLAEVDFLVVNGGVPETGAWHMDLVGEVLVNLRDPSVSCALATWSGQAVHAVAGIGHPQRFFDALRRHGLQVVAHPFPDHHVFQAADLAFDDALPILMTEKDAVKCHPWASARCWYLPVRARLDAELERRLTARLAALRPVSVRTV
ncbi:MAG TPA: tetraacyldisaccharide 4'-kinase [Candidatus Competibacteraceae bacterium]|nr:tetraacyldisaccharide 4'-kinase [Candidatus Competibacteraceae bacterium]